MEDEERDREGQAKCTEKIAPSIIHATTQAYTVMTEMG
jgi:hypothetical protein